MSRPIRIGNAHGFWGDDLYAAAETLARDPDLDVLTLDFLAEVSMSILALQQQRDPNGGYCRDFLEIIRLLIPYWKDGGRCRVISNAGGLNPHACAIACQDLLHEAQCDGIRIAVVSGDDVLPHLRASVQSEGDIRQTRNLDSGEPLRDVIQRLTTANAYLGARPIVEALQQHADLIITGRVADPSLTVAPCVHHFGWAWNDWDRLAGATVAGHLIECGTQATGGISTAWCDVPEVANIGFPIVEVASDGSCELTKPLRTGGCVTVATVKEQLLYEIGDPDAYLSPDVIVSFLSLEVQTSGTDRVRVSGAKGRPAPATLKVSATYQNGFRAAGQLTVFGAHAVAKARRAAQVVLDQLAERGVTFRDTRVQFIGAGACRPNRKEDDSLLETVLRISVADTSREAVDQFSRQLMPLVTAGPPGTTCYADGRPRVHPYFAFWPCLVDAHVVKPQVELLDSRGHPQRPKPACAKTIAPVALTQQPVVQTVSPCTSGDHAATVLGDVAHARSGDKGRHANIGVIALSPQLYQQLVDEVTARRVADFLGVSESAVTRYELANLCALNFLVREILDPLSVDAQGKALGQWLLQMPIGPSN